MVGLSQRLPKDGQGGLAHPGKGAESVCGCILNATGHLLADVKVINRGDSLLLDMSRENTDKIYRLLDGWVT